MHIFDSVFQTKVRFYKLYEWWRASSVLTENQKSVLTENCPKTKKCELFTWGLWSGRNPEGVFLLPKSNIKWCDISHHLHMSFLLVVPLIHQLMSNLDNAWSVHIIDMHFHVLQLAIYQMVGTQGGSKMFDKCEQQLCQFLHKNNQRPHLAH